MPIYQFYCVKCDTTFETVMSLKNYIAKAKCPTCKRISKERDYQSCNIIGSVPKTLGSYADKNTSRMSEDQKESLQRKHQHYLYEDRDKPLAGKFDRMKRPEHKTVFSDEPVVKRRERRKLNGKR